MDLTFSVLISLITAVWPFQFLLTKHKINLHLQVLENDFCEFLGFRVGSRRSGKIVIYPIVIYPISCEC